MSLLVSFCIPTYNGIKYLPELLDSLLPQLDEKAEVVLCDDGSSDGTYAFLCELAGRDIRVKAFRNERNLGMDRNFHQTVKHARGEYVWLSGQDDVFGPGAYRKFLQIVAEHPDTDMVYFNYRQLFDGPPKYYGLTFLDISTDSFFRGSTAYFERLDHAPSFLPATIMRRSYWQSTDVSVFYDTIFVQVGCWLMNCKDANVYVVADPTHIDCRCPLDSWKYTDGIMWFGTLAGDLEVYHYMYKHHPDVFPERVYTEKRDSFIRNLPFNVVFYKNAGMITGEKQKQQMRDIFRKDAPWTYYLYVLPLTRMPVWLAKYLYRLYANSAGRSILRWLRRVLLPFKA